MYVSRLTVGTPCRQTAMYIILDTLTRLLALFWSLQQRKYGISSTQKEDNPESVMFNDWPSNPAYENKELEVKWDKLLEVGCSSQGTGRGKKSETHWSVTSGKCDIESQR